MTGLFEKHRNLLADAVKAIEERGFWSAFSEVPRSYGETLPAEGKAAFEALIEKPFALDQEADDGRVGGEVSPFGRALGITYPRTGIDRLIARASASAADWARASVEVRCGVALEIITRLNKVSFLMAHAVEQTTGQAFAMAFQAGGPHAQDRALEAVAYAYREMTSIPQGDVAWDKPAGRNVIRLTKEFHIVPRGVGLVIACATFPTWNSYPALFADVVTGNPVIVKPHPAVILPLAITVKIAREVLMEAGFDADVVQLAVDMPEAPVAPTLAVHPAVALVDFTGSSEFGGWLREHVRGKPVFTEETGINTIVIDSADDFAAMCQNIAFSLSLYSGQMCTTPQDIFVPQGGIETNDGHKSFDEVAAGIAAAVDGLLADPQRAAAVCGAIQNPATLDRVGKATGLGRVVRASAPVGGLENGRTATPLILAVEASEAAYLKEQFGPISFVVSCEDATDAIDRATHAARAKGGITAALYSRDADLIDKAVGLYAQAGVPLSVNLTGGIYVNQSAAFSDFHVTGANPAGNACLTDTAYVAQRFRVVCVRRPAAA
ncbi:phenylacetic acid degradation protein PaaN [Rhizobium sp. ARZ01]|uniref:phenylacetic acid degradation protein PaaN n=1 Tax=Rhizobium sp. ARZ01 TaxID=2769313 RepID=UPI00177FC836|nr:phenylacetic acid degradation protein PaaN [Rhizobium sp. ARZ01]MBD9374561.1 phenylacetic acid degradation protein PaaN [Rhizobium sp. ARZ01]